MGSIVDLAGWRQEHEPEVLRLEAAVQRLDAAFDGYDRDEVPAAIVTEVLAIQGCISMDLLEEAEEKKRGSLYCKVSQKGAVSVYGLQRMPVTLYVEQWERLLDFGDEIRRFMGEHESELKRKEK
jgi:hypothetical protein